MEAQPYHLILGNALEVLPRLAANSVDCCITSPPYWGLRDYGTARWEGGDPECDHRPDSTPGRRGLASSTLAGGKSHTGHQQEGFAGVCPRCGAVRVDEQIGLEGTLEEYVSKLTAVFEEVRRVLKPQGTLWLNLGDSYGTGAGPQSAKSTLRGNGHIGSNNRYLLSLPQIAPRARPLPAKNLLGIPWRVAFALQDAGWILRQDIIWHKLNPLPESVTDRCTKAHEYIFLFAKEPRYYFDQRAIQEPASGQSPGNRHHRYTEAYRDGQEHHRTKGGLVDYAQRMRTLEPSEGKIFRNRRSVWSMVSQPFSGTHFAVMPLSLAEMMVLAGCPAGGVVLDPFSGAGTTGLAALKHGRRYLGIELNPRYLELSRERLTPIAEQPLLLAGD
ncbi:site-specific DNA-methyltransferase [Meiothermus sp. Pnk-1]|uniref:DNA-methyltransferase n=1 Tax=Meiothermus sp. Pnk-1 TaxID=873128 RepID=UPI000D7CE3CC|nr:site-specific DNA-methyltransferase [Meiothermus sp. Pnk-1]PZA08296.1 site-specific DNA-methyltransferase [Meiothermus sp. Pnk-1]